jgi:hypothetical protein
MRGDEAPKHDIFRFSAGCSKNPPVPQIFDNTDQSLLPTPRETLHLADRADLCVGYFNLDGGRLMVTVWP